MNKIKILGLVLGLVALGFASAQGVQHWQHRQGPERARMRMGILAMAEELGLSAEQRQEVRQARLAAQKEIIELRAKMRILRLELRELMRADEPDRKAIEAKTKQIGELRTRLDLARINSRITAKSVLTAEQKEKMKELRKRFARRRLERRMRERPQRPRRQPRRPMPPERGQEFEG